MPTASPYTSTQPYYWNPIIPSGMIPTGPSGRGPFGTVPQAITTPDPYANLSQVYPNLGDTNTATSQDILSKLKGVLSPNTQAMLQQAAATFGVRSGMPGSGGTLGTLTNNLNLQSLGLASEQQQQQGLQDYASIIPAISRTQTVSPELQTQIAETNAINAAAPDPAASQSYARSLFDQYLKTLRGNTPAGGLRNYVETNPNARNQAMMRGANPDRPWESSWASDTPNAPSGGALFPEEQPGQSSFDDWYTRTFGRSPVAISPAGSTEPDQQTTDLMNELGFF